MANFSARAAASFSSDVGARRDASLRMSDRCCFSSSLTGHSIGHRFTDSGSADKTERRVMDESSTAFHGLS